MVSVEEDSRCVQTRVSKWPSPDRESPTQPANGPETVPTGPTLRTSLASRVAVKSRSGDHTPAGAMPRRVTSLAPPAPLAALCFLALAAIRLPSALALECDEAMTGFHDNEIKSQAWQDIAHANVQAIRDAVADDPCYAMMRAGDGRGPLFWAHEFYNQEIIDVLVHHGADRAARDRGGKRPDQMIRAPPMTFEAPPADDEEEYEYGADDDDDDVYVTKSSSHDEM